MKYKLRVYSIWEQGHFRDNQEDCIFPPKNQESDNDRLFVICDGMGGMDKGEVASSVICESLSGFILRNSSPEGEFNENLLVEGLNEAIKDLNNAAEHSVSKMGTTLALLKFHQDGVTIGHVGDSRVYHIRPRIRSAKERSIILFQTKDHSLVNDLIKIGELTELEAKTSPQKNIITRAILPNQERNPKIDIKHISDIQKDDYFFLCSDGMLSFMDNNQLGDIISQDNHDDLYKVDQLVLISDDSHDNHSAFLIHVVDVIADNDLEHNERINNTNSTRVIEKNKNSLWNIKLFIKKYLI